MIKSPVENTMSVWQALFLREALDRFFGTRAAWAWLILEPMVQVCVFAYIYGMIRGRLPIGGDIHVWLATGLLTFFVFRRTAIQTLHAVDCNKAFFCYRQVRPFDAALCRGGVEAFSMLIVATVCAVPFMAAGKDMIPHDPLMVLAAVIGMWMMGFGYGLIASVFMRLIPESGHIFTIIMMPMYFLSGAIFPLFRIPPIYRQYFIYNPHMHAIELIRLSFFDNYHTMDVNITFVYAWAFGLVIIGMCLYKLAERRLLQR